MPIWPTLSCQEQRTLRKVGHMSIQRVEFNKPGEYIEFTVFSYATRVCVCVVLCVCRFECARLFIHVALFLLQSGSHSSWHGP